MWMNVKDIIDYDVVIPTRQDNEKLQIMLSCLTQQTVRPRTVFCLYDENNVWKDTAYADEKKDQRIMRWYKLVWIYETGWNGWVSAKRNRWITLTTSQYVLLLDDDNEFSTDFVEKLYEWQKKYWWVVSPLIMRRHSEIVQSRGFAGLSPWTWLLMKAKTQTIRCLGWNSLFGQREIFEKVVFDENIPFVYEDIERSMRLTKKEKLTMLHDVPIYHMERDKSRAERSFVWSPNSVYYKVKHGLILIRKHFSLWQKTTYVLSGFWLYHWWLLFLIVFFWQKKLSLLRAFVRGLRDWFTAQV